MSTWETLMIRFGAEAERQYLRAKASGMVDPLLFLRAVDPEDPRKVEVRVWERASMLEHLRETCPAAVESVASRTGFDTFSIALVLPDGLHLIDRRIRPAEPRRSPGAFS